MKMSYRSTIVIWLFVLSIISIISLIRSCNSDVPLDMDYAGILVGILAALCTVLIGWQIFSFMEFSKRESENTQKISDVAKALHDFNERVAYQTYLNHYAISDIYASLAGGKIIDNVEYECVKNRIEALYYASELNEWDLCRNIANLTASFIRKKKIRMNDTEKTDLINVLLSTNSKEFAKEFCELLEAVREIAT